MLGNIPSVSVSVLVMTVKSVNYSFGIVSATAKTENTVSAETEKCGFTQSLL